MEQTEWHHIVAWRGLADIAAKYLQKGKLIYLEGKLRTRSFEDKAGNKKQITEIVADQLTMLGRKDGSDALGVAEGKLTRLAKQEEQVNYEDGPDDDLPF